jgi:hypothetical protein
MVSPAGRDNGMQTEPWQAPSGFNVQPVPASNSLLEMWSEFSNIGCPLSDG